MDLHVYRNSQDRWHDLRAAARVQGAVLASNAVTLDELIQRLTPDLKAASPGQRLVFIERASRDVEFPNVTRYAYDAVRELKAARVKPANLRDAGAESLGTILETYSRLLKESGLVDAEDRCWAAASRVSEGHAWLQQFDSVVVHAIYDLNDAEFALLHNLIETLPAGGTVMLFNTTANIKATQFAEWTWQRFIRDESLADKTFPEFFRASGPASELLERLFVFDAPSTPLREASALRVLQCPGRYREVEAIGAEIAELLAAGTNPNEIAIVVRHIDTYGEMIEDVLTRYGIQHTFETGVPLLRIPFIKYWMALLDLVTGERSRDAMTRVLSSAYFEPRLSGKVDVEKTLAEIGYIDRHHLSASALAARRNSPLTAEFERFESLLTKLEGMTARPMAFLEHLTPPAGLTDRDRQAWRVLFDEIEAVDPLLGDVPFVHFRKIASELAGIRTVDRFSNRLAAPGVPRVRIMAPRALGSRSYSWIFAPGYADGEIPSSTRSNPLLPETVIDKLNGSTYPRRILNSRDRNRREPLFFFMTLDAATKGAVLTCPVIDLEGEPIYPSIYVSEIARHYAEPPLTRVGRAQKVREVGEFRRKVAAAWRNDLIEESHAHALLDEKIIRLAQWEKRGIGRADIGPKVLSGDRVWSPSELNALAACPFVFLARHHLRVRAIELPDFEVPPAEVGNLAHRILREFYGRPIPDSETAAVTRMQDIITRQLAEVDISGKGPNIVIDPSLWKIRRPQLVRALLEYVRFAVLDARDGFETLPEYLDRSLPPARLGPATLAGRPDHVAVRRSGDTITGIRIDDFKYSAASSNMSRQLRDSFQIPVYAYLTVKALDAEPSVPIQGRYLLLRSPSSPVVASGVDQMVFDDIAIRMEDLLDKVHAGRLHPEPADKQQCAGCEYRRLCRLYGA